MCTNILTLWPITSNYYDNKFQSDELNERIMSDY